MKAKDQLKHSSKKTQKNSPIGLQLQKGKNPIAPGAAEFAMFYSAQLSWVLVNSNGCLHIPAAYSQVLSYLTSSLTER